MKVFNAEDNKHNGTIQLSIVNCGQCGGTYSINERFRKQCEQNGTGWTCPYCRSRWGYFGETEAQRLAKQLKKSEKEAERQKKLKEWAETDARNAKNRERAQKAAKARLKNRISAGQCPCCDEKFSDLADHIRNEHPGYESSSDDKS